MRSETGLPATKSPTSSPFDEGGHPQACHHPDWFRYYSVPCASRRSYDTTSLQDFHSHGVEYRMVPEWDERGLIPPVIGDGPQGPYVISPLEIVERFGSTKKRRDLLTGLLGLRSALYSAGILFGFQWINGSFVEDVEQRRKKAPSDIDVVTFISLTQSSQQGFLRKYPSLFGKLAKTAYGIDSFLVSLDDPVESIVENSAYWNNLWSHSRETYEWKGYLRMSLSLQDDGEARIALKRLEVEEGANGN